MSVMSDKTAGQFTVEVAVQVDLDAWCFEYGVDPVNASSEVRADLYEWAAHWLNTAKWHGLAEVTRVNVTAGKP
jgi:hypothetical protein